MEYNVDICQLSPCFYAAYPPDKYPEILQKNERPYTCLTIEFHNGYFICIPFRSSIRHNEAFLFFNTRRSSHSRSGLDYKKVVLIKNPSYLISTAPVVIDNDEYTCMISNIETIVSEIHAYITKYTNHVSGRKILHHREFSRSFAFSTLPYFHDILKI